MATLHGTGLDHRDYSKVDRSFSISPVSCGETTSSGLYEVSYGPDWKGDVISHTYDVSDWQQGGAYFVGIADAFASVGILRKSAMAPSGKATPALYAGLDFMRLCIFGVTDRLHVLIFIAKQDASLSPAEYQYAQFHITVTEHEARRFGEELNGELSATLRFKPGCGD